MTQILANYSTSISELKKSPSAVIEKSDGEAVAILNHNKPMAYLVPSALYEEMVAIIDEHRKKNGDQYASRDLDDTDMESYLEDWDGCDA